MWVAGKCIASNPLHRRQLADVRRQWNAASPERQRVTRVFAFARDQADDPVRVVLPITGSQGVRRTVPALAWR